MQLRYVFSELGQGLRRNLSMHVAVILTLFVSLTLVGLGVMLSKQAAKTTDYFGSQLEITVWLCKDKDSTPACATQVTDAQPGSIRGDFATTTNENLVHGSDGPESAEREIGLWFPGR